MPVVEPSAPAESAAPTEPVGGQTAAPSVPESGGLADSNEKSFALSDEVMWGDLDEAPAEPAPQSQTSAQPSEGATPQPAAQPAQAQTPQQATPPAQVPAAQAPAQPVQAPAAQPQAQPGAPQPSGAPSPQPQFNLSAELAKYKGEIINDLAAKSFALAPEEVKALEEDAVGFIPKLAARIYYESATTAINQINNMVPKIVEHVVGQLRSTNEAEDSFYREWPTIDRSTHAQQVQLAANLYRQANPPQANFTPQQQAEWKANAIRSVGAMVTTMLGLPQRAAPQGTPQVPNGNGGRPRTVPFSPASGGGRIASTQAIPDPWVGMGANFDE